MIFRIHRDTNYITTSIFHLRDKSLSWQAMGMLSFMLSCKDDFKFSIEGLTQCASNGNSATRSALKELRDKGYVVVSPIKDGGRVVEWNYDIYENPDEAAIHNKVQDDQKPHVEIPDVENPHVENSGQRNNIIEEELSLDNSSKNNNINYILLNKEDSSSKEINKERRFQKPTLKEVAAYCEERKNNVSPQRFIDYYESNGWMVGRTHMKNWKAAVRTWEGKENKQLNNSTYGNKNNDAGLGAERPQPRQRDYSRTSF